MRLLLAGLMALLASCASSTATVLESGNQTQLEKRSYQTRYFETGDKEFVLRGMISTLQDLGFVIDSANLMLGSVSGTRFFQNKSYKATGNVRVLGQDRSAVRVNFQFELNPIEDPQHYQNFFAALSKSLFLQANVE